MSLPVIETRRLHIARLGATDPDSLREYLIDNQAYHAPWEPLRDPKYFSRVDINARIRRDRADPASRRFVLSEFTGEVVGLVDLTDIRGAPFYAANLTFSVAAAFQGIGLIHEAVSALLPYAFDELALNRITAWYATANHRAARLLSQLGFEIEGLAEQSMCIAGTWEDHVTTALLRQRWTARAGLMPANDDRPRPHFF
jgi:ribosomal-protein-alanine N-acetyltransferase